MEYATIRAKWQITIPKRIRRGRGLWIGQALSIMPGAEDLILVIPGSYPGDRARVEFQKAHGKVGKPERKDFRISHGKGGPGLTARLLAALNGQDAEFLEELRRRYGGGAE